MLTKSHVLESLKDLPDKFSLDEIVDRLILMSKIEEGLEQSKKGELYTTEEAKKLINKWSK